MASFPPGKKKPVGGTVSSSNNNTIPTQKNLRTTRLGGFDLHAVATFVFQLVALIVALVFGAWAIKSYDATLQANDLQISSNSVADQQASVQHQIAVASGRLAMADYCQRYGYPENGALCDAIITGLPLASIASIFSVPVPRPASTTSTSSRVTPTATSPTSTRSGSMSIAGTSSTALGGIPSSTITVGSPGSGTTTSSSVTQPSLGLGAIFGIIVGSVVMAGAILGLIMVCLRKRSQTLYEE